VEFDGIKKYGRNEVTEKDLSQRTLEEEEHSDPVAAGAEGRVDGEEYDLYGGEGNQRVDPDQLEEASNVPAAWWICGAIR